MELLKDYDCTIEYHLVKANVDANALSQKSRESLYYIHTTTLLLLIELWKLNVELIMDASSGVLATLKIKLMLLEKIVAAQQVNKETEKLREDAKSEKIKKLKCTEEGVLKFENKLYIPDVEELR